MPINTDPKLVTRDMMTSFGFKMVYRKVKTSNQVLMRSYKTKD